MAAKKTSTPRQKAAQERLVKASKAASAKGLKGQAFKDEVRRLTKGKGGGTKTSSPGRKGGARKAASAIATVGTTARRKSRGLLQSLTPAKGAQIFFAADGMLEGYDRYQNGAEFWEVMEPVADGLATAGAVRVASRNSYAAPGLTGKLLNWHPFRDPPPKFTATRVVNALPSAIGWYEGQRRYRKNVEIWRRQPETLTPRFAAATGIQVQRSGTGRLRLAANKNTILDGAAAPVLAGGAISKIVTRMHLV